MYSITLLALLGLATLGRSTAQQQDYIPAAQMVAGTMQQAPSALTASTLQDDEDDDGDRIFTFGLKATIDGIDYDNITPEHELFLEDALAFAFNKVHKDTDEMAISSHLMSKSLEKDNGSGRRLRYCPGYTCGKKTHSSWGYTGSWSCRFCADNRLLTELEGSSRQTRWENKLCKMLRDSQYAVFEDVENCKFKIKHNDHDSDVDILEVATATATAPLWSRKQE